MTMVGRRWRLLVSGVVLGGLFAVAEYAAGAGTFATASSFVVIVVYALIVSSLQRRSETMSALAGRPVDERWKLIHDRALAFSAQVGLTVALVGFLAMELQRRESGQFATVAAAMGLSYIGGIVMYRWRV